MADRIDIASLIANADLPAIVGSFSELRKRGPEYVCRCIFHSPDNTPSLTVYQKGAKWYYKCHSCGEGGDALDFIQAAEGIESKTEAAKRLNGGAVWTPRIAPEPLPPKVERITAKPPTGAPEPTFTHREYGEPQVIIPFRDADGQILGYECRWATVNRAGEPDKEVRILSWGRRDQEGAKWRWGWGHFNKPRWIWGLDLLAARPDASFAIFEGPGKARAAADLLPMYVCIAWTGGANSWHRHDWSPLAGKRGIIWPDADSQLASEVSARSAGCAPGDLLPYEWQPGPRAALELARLLADPARLACEVKLIDVRDQSGGWDIGDAAAAGWTPSEVFEWAKQRVRIFKAPEAVQVPEQVTAGADPSSVVTPERAEGPADEPPPAEFPPEASAERPNTSHEQKMEVPNFEQGPRLDKVSGILYRRISDVPARNVDWLWPGRIAKGKFSVIVGNPGLGKSQVTASLAAVVTRGGKWPVDRTQAEIGNVVIMSAEDDAEDTIRPRLEAAGADLERVILLQAVKVEGDRATQDQVRGFNLEADTAKLGALLAEIGDVALVIIDPISAYLGKADSHNNAEVRALLAPLVEIAGIHGAAILAVSHLTKSQGMDALLRLQGSVAFSAAARAVWGVAKDKDNPQRRLFMPLKNNLGTDDTGFAYTVEGYTLEGTDPPITTSHVMWENELVTQSAEDVFASSNLSNEERTEVDDAKDFLRGLLSDGEMESTQLLREARQAGHAEKTIRRAGKALGVDAKREHGIGSKGRWYWRMPITQRRDPYRDD